jgi:hypothetical protein
MSYSKRYSSKIVEKEEILYYVLFLIPAYNFQVTKFVQFRRFHRQHQCTLQLVCGHGVLLVCTVYSEIVLSRKPFGKGHMYI